MEISKKKIILTVLSAGLMILSNVVDTKLSEDDIRDAVKKELEIERKKKKQGV